MLKWSFFSFLSLLFVWEIVVRIHPGEHLNLLIHKRIGQFEDYLLDTSNGDSVMLGSSLCRQIPQAQMGGLKNFGLSAMGSIHGLKLLEKKGTSPAFIMIETSKFFVQVYNPVFLEQFGSVPMATKKHLHALRMRNRLVNALVYPLHFRMKPLWAKVYLLQMKVSQRLGLDPFSTALSTKSDMMAQRMEGLRKEYHDPANAQRIKENIREVSKFMRLDKFAGTKLVFFEMPIDPELVHSPNFQLARKLLKEKFPDVAYLQVPENLDPYPTTDGMHLTKADALRYFQQVLRPGLEKAQNR